MFFTEKINSWIAFSSGFSDLKSNNINVSAVIDARKETTFHDKETPVYIGTSIVDTSGRLRIKDIVNFSIYNVGYPKNINMVT